MGQRMKCDQLVCMYGSTVCMRVCVYGSTVCMGVLCVWEYVCMGVLCVWEYVCMGVLCVWGYVCMGVCVWEYVCMGVCVYGSMSVCLTPVAGLDSLHRSGQRNTDPWPCTAGIESVGSKVNIMTTEQNHHGITPTCPCTVYTCTPTCVCMYIYMYMYTCICRCEHWRLQRSKEEVST